MDPDAGAVVVNPEPPDWRGRLRAAAPRIAAGAVLGAVAMALAFRGVSWSELRAALSRTDPRWLLAGFASVLASLTAYTTRWWLLFSPDHRERNWWTLASAVLAGQAVNIAIPARLGELARIYIVGTRDSVSRIRILATIVVEMVVEFTFFAVNIAILLVAMTLPAWLSRSGFALIGAATLVMIGTIVLAFWGGPLLRHLESLTRRLPGRWGDRVSRLARSALLSLQFLRSWQMATLVSALSGIIVFFSVTTNYLLLRASGIHLPYVAALFLLVVLRIGEAPPSLPGKLGVFHYLVVLALSMFGVSRTQALSYALVLYAVAVVPVIVAGGCLIVFMRKPAADRAARNQIVPS